LANHFERGEDSVEGGATGLSAFLDFEFTKLRLRIAKQNKAILALANLEPYKRFPTRRKKRMA